jgi:hypothetical protein
MAPATKPVDTSGQSLALQGENASYSIEELKKKHREAKAVRERFIPDWVLNLAFYVGGDLQWCYWNRGRLDRAIHRRVARVGHRQPHPAGDPRPGREEGQEPPRLHHHPLHLGRGRHRRLEDRREGPRSRLDRPRATEEALSGDPLRRHHLRRVLEDLLGLDQGRLSGVRLRPEQPAGDDQRRSHAPGCLRQRPAGRA